MKRELNVVVSGRTASGKTTVARVIAETLAALGIDVEVLPEADGDDTKELAARRLPGILSDGIKVTVSTRQDCVDATHTLRASHGQAPATAQADSVPAVERIAFKDAHRHLDLDEVPDAWGRPMFKHSHVEASWLGWIARAARAPADSVAAPAMGDELRDTLVAVSAAIAERDDRAAQKMIGEILAASPTPPAEQATTTEAATPKAGVTTGAALGGVYAELPQPDSWFHFTPQYWENTLRDFADRTHALRMQAAPKTAPGEYKKHFLGLSDNVTYFIEHIDASKVSTRLYTVVFKPSTVVPSADLR